MRAGQTAVSGTRGDMRAGQARTERQESNGTRGDMRAGQARAERRRATGHGAESGQAAGETGEAGGNVWG